MAETTFFPDTDTSSMSNCGWYIRNSDSYTYKGTITVGKSDLTMLQDGRAFTWDDVTGQFILQHTYEELLLLLCDQ